MMDLIPNTSLVCSATSMNDEHHAISMNISDEMRVTIVDNLHKSIQ